MSNLGVSSPATYANVSTNSQINSNRGSLSGGKRMGKRMSNHTLKTGRHGRGAFLKNWSRQQPGYHERTNMLRTCGKKCFLGPNKSFPICTRNTCKINRKGVYAAYIRANEYKTMRGTRKYSRISNKAHKLIKKLY
jgi:hypothetical protein|uniref:Uncharacterized protein n=1 Tax=viral metagenome TaxID=1070528 RepID=A0A6C0ASS5_9ZZZZ